MLKARTIFTLPERVLDPELMDEPGLAESDHFAALTGLGRINLLSLASLGFRRPLLEMARGHKPERPLRVLDVACGGGGTSIWVARLARRANAAIEVTGLDISAQALRFAAREAESKRVKVIWMQRDVLANGLPEGFDVILCSLFLHHLTEAQATALLGEMFKRARRGVLVNDLVRSKAGLWLARLVPPIVSRSYVVHVDAVLSARSAFTMQEIRQMANAVGMHTAQLGRRWPERFMLDWRRSTE
ncbi:MAG: methyltransferase domain-containing protein [Candidatus Hydrogenedens sp.]|nr:methyltransferase domain-containing protein [Candidatus Hydrogenedens sp.]